MLFVSMYAQHSFQLALALVAIALLRRRVPADYGLHWPKGRTFIKEAVLWGIFFGALMTLVDYSSQLLARTTPMLDYPLTTPNVLGWLFSKAYTSVLTMCRETDAA